MKKNSIIIIVIAVLVLGGGAYALMNKSDDKDNTADTTGTNQTSDATAGDTADSAETDSAADTADKVAAATITYKDGSFSPSTVTVKAGETVKIVNGSTDAVNFESDPHPTHTDNTDLNAGEIAPGGSAIVTTMKTGAWGYHNHFNESETGTLVVQ